MVGITNEHRPLRFTSWVFKLIHLVEPAFMLQQNSSTVKKMGFKGYRFLAVHYNTYIS